MTQRIAPLEVVVDGRHLSALAPWGDLTWSNRWPGGCGDASWGLNLKRYARHPLLRRGALVQIMQGPVCRWCGELGQPDWAAGTFRAYGMASAAGGFVALDGSGNATTTPSVAVATAIGDGWPVVADPATIPATPLTETTDDVLMLDQLLERYSDAQVRRFTVRADRVARFEPDPVAPTWALRPGVADLSPAEDNYASTAVLRYVNTDGAYATLKYTDPDADEGTVQKPVDVTAYGQLDDATAASIAAGLLAKGLSQLGWESGLTVGPAELMTIGGRRASMNRVRAGQMVRVHARPGSLPAMGGRSYRDLILEEDTHTGGSDDVGIKFLGTAARTDDEVVKELFAAIGRTAA